MRLAGRVLTRGADGTTCRTASSRRSGGRPPNHCNSQPCSVACRCFRPPSPACRSWNSAAAVTCDVSPMVLQPDVSRSRRDFIADIVASRARRQRLHAHRARLERRDRHLRDTAAAIRTVTDESDDPARPDLRFSYLGHAYTADDVVHSKFLNVPGRLRGLGPISAARERSMPRSSPATTRRSSSRTARTSRAICAPPRTSRRKPRR